MMEDEFMDNQPSLNEEGHYLGIKKLYNDIVWTHKIHEEQADIYSTNGKRLQIASIASIAMTAILAGVNIGVNCIWLSMSTTALALMATFVAIYREAKPFDVLVCDHSSYAKNYLHLREDLTSILTKKLIDEGAVDCVRCKYVQLCEHAPRTSDKAVKRAEIAIRSKEEKLFEECFKRL